MSFSYDAFARFTKALQAWLAADATLVTLTGHTGAAGGFRIYIIQGTDLLHEDSLLIDPVDADPWHPNVDHLIVSTVNLYSYARTRVKALNIIGAAYKKCSQSETTLLDPYFSSSSIRVRLVRPYGIDQMGEEMFIASSIRRTERSDSPMPDRHMCAMPIQVVWQDTTA